MKKFNTTNSDGWEFDEDTGCLYHPCGCLTSWFRKDGDKWVPLEWADYHPDESEIVTIINS